MDKLTQALSSFLTDDAADLARVLALFLDRDRVGYRDMAAVAPGGVGDALLTLWEWRLVIPVRAGQCGEWDYRVLLAEPGETYEMPNISHTLVRKGAETGRWDSSAAIVDLFQEMGEPGWAKMPDLVRSIKGYATYNTVTGARIGAACGLNGLGDKTGAMIAILKGAGVISPKMAATGAMATARSPLYELNPCVYPELKSE